MPSAAWEGRALTKLGELAFVRGDLARAADHLTRARDRLASIEVPREEERFLAGQVEFWIGYVHLERGELEAAAAPLQRYLDISRALAAEDPANVRWKVEVAYGHTNLGALLHARGRVEEAETEFRRVVESWRTLTVHDPANSEWQRELADALSWLSTSVLSRWRVADALAPLNEERGIRELLTARDPANLEWLRMRTICENNLGNVMEALGRPDEARSWFASAVAHSRTLVDAEGTNSDWRSECAVLTMRLGRVLLQLGDAQAAREHLDAALRNLEQLCASAEPKQQWILDLASCRLDRAALCLFAGADADATAELDRTEALLDDAIFATAREDAADDQRALLYFLRGRLLERAGERERALSAWRAALAELEPGVWDAFQTQRVRTYTLATRCVDGESAVARLFDRFRALGYVPAATLR